MPIWGIPALFINGLFVEPIKASRSRAARQEEVDAAKPDIERLKNV